MPEGWKLQALRDGNFVDVQLKERPVALDKWCEASFTPLTTTALRLVVTQKPGWASGIHEWKIVRAED